MIKRSTGRLNERIEEDWSSSSSSDNATAIASVSSSSSSSSLTSLECTHVIVEPSKSSSFSDNKTRKDDDEHLWWIHGNAYFLEDFVKHHPGGKEAILLGKGRDCTALIESYHPFSSDRVWKILDKHRCDTETAFADELKEETKKKEDEYSVATTSSSSIISESRTVRASDFFYEILKERVSKELQSKGIDPVKDRGASPLRIIYYVTVFILWSYTGYLHCIVRKNYCVYSPLFSCVFIQMLIKLILFMYFPFPTRMFCLFFCVCLTNLLKASLWGSFGFAIMGWLMGALGHDAGHFAASRLAVVNEFGVWAMSFICNPILWQQQHTYGHHSFTNEFDRDPDLHHFDVLLRVHKKLRYEPKYRFQSNILYVMFAYLFVVFGTCFWIPWSVLKDGTLYGMVDWNDKNRPIKYYGMLLHLISYLGIVIVVPICMHESMVKAALATYIHVGTLGITFALFSQINHLNEPSLKSDMDSRQRQLLSNDKQQQQANHPRDPRLTHSWAAAQVETSNNFASRSIFWHVISNGLNHQIEHHLFPSLNHGHLYHIAPTVKRTCDEYGVEYKSYDTWNELMNATLNWFEKLSVIEYSDVSVNDKKPIKYD